jgi:hypothetical protein
VFVRSHLFYLLAAAAILVVALAATPRTIPRASAAAGQEIYSPIKTKLSYSRGPGGSLTRRVVYSSKYPECIAPDRVKWGSEISPEFYFFTYPGQFESTFNTQFKFPQVGPHTYELTLSGSTPIKVALFNAEKGVEETRIEPLANFASVTFFARILGGSITVKRHGETKHVYCYASHARESVKTIQL